MKKVKKFLFTMLISFLVIIGIMALTACNSKDDNDGENNYFTQEDKTMTADEAEALFLNLKIDVNRDFKISMNFGGDTGIYYLAHSGNDLLIKCGEGIDSITIVTRMDGQWAEFESYTDYDQDTCEEISVKEYRILNEWEYDDIKESILEQMNDFSGQALLKSVQESNYKAVLQNGDAAKIQYAGVMYANGGGNIQAKFQQQSYSGKISDVNVYATFDEQGAITEITESSETTLEYRPDNTNDIEFSQAHIVISYGNVSIPVNPTGYTKSTSGPVNVYYSGDLNAMNGFKHASVNGGETVEIPAPVVEGIQFEGWYYDSALKFPVPKSGDKYLVKTPENFGEEGHYNSVRIYAKWEDAIKPTLVLNGGELSDYVQECTNTIYEISQYRYIQPTLIGKVFGGWYYDADFTQEVKATDGVVKNVTLYAKYVDYVVITLSVEGIGYKLPKLIGGPEEYSRIPSDIAVKGYMVEGWYLDEEFTQAVENVNIMPESSATYYAKLEKGICVNLDGNGHELPKYITIPATGDLKTLMDILDDFQLKGSAIGNDEGEMLYFGGWEYTDGSEITSYPTSEVSIRAVFSAPIQITLSYDPSLPDYTDGGLIVQLLKNYTSNLASALESYKYRIDDEIPEGYYLDGWYLDSEFNTKIDEDAAWPSANVTVYARFAEIPR